MLQDVGDTSCVHTFPSVLAREILHLAPRQTELITAKAHRAYLRQVAKSTGYSLNRIATEIGIAPSTLTRVANAEDDAPNALRAATLTKLKAYSGIEPPAIDVGERPAVKGLREDAAPFEAQGADPDVASMVALLLKSRRAAAPFTVKSRALECAGVLPGDTVIVDLGIVARPGDLVCAQVYEWRADTAETVFRIYEPPYLVAATFDENLRKPLAVDDDKVIIKGVILPHRLRAQR